jgi:hypothetical protein
MPVAYVGHANNTDTGKVAEYRELVSQISDEHGAIASPKDISTSKEPTLFYPSLLHAQMS